MPTFKLEPTSSEHPYWKYSSYRDVCMVEAHSEDEARKSAARKFSAPRSEIDGARHEPEESPWENHSAVKCTLVSDAPPIEEYGRSHVTLSPMRNRVIPVVMSSQTNVGRDMDVKSDSASSLSVEEPHVLNLSKSYELNSRVRSSIFLVQYQARTLLTTIEDVLRPDKGNAPPSHLWLPGDDHEAELLKLLSQIRDELARLNDFIEQTEEAKATPKALKKASGALGEIAMTYFKSAAVAAGTATGGMFAVMLVEQLISLELISWDKAKEIMEIFAK